MNPSENEVLEMFYHRPALEVNMEGEIHAPWIILSVPRRKLSWRPECGAPTHLTHT